MTTKIRISNDATSNGDLIIDAVNTTEGRINDAVLRPGDSREFWITNLSMVSLTETWPAQPLPKSDVEIIAECGDSGAKWAKAFKEKFPNADESTMLAWFANAIEAASTARAMRGKDDRPAATESLGDDVNPSQR
jgi:hypothetical protein